MSPKATDEGCSRERQRLTPLEHPSSVSALRADPPSPTRGEGAGHRLGAFLATLKIGEICQRCQTWPPTEPTAALPPLAPKRFQPFAKLRAA
ncbi:MAG: hypothetical protein EOQ30_19995 [Mesorhizobium sp.]|nr:MAG: hypothetical protein EOQ29_33990 [Mesorhizobium sp.]RWA81442.1 MAG: hypothetical protein EOQ30_19995 [Mesorhizobium sp.]RWB13124.1 MAG: hypothetical protein EOQ40_32060 [Mesorhizobium sp.]TIS44587.1 MAG: hypothetical protein E5W96_35645 [Mesorhizobium sp.]